MPACSFWLDIEQDRFHVHVKELIVSQLVILVILHELVGHASCYLARLISPQP